MKHSLDRRGGQLLYQSLASLLIGDTHEAWRAKPIDGQLEVAHQLLLEADDLIDQTRSPLLLLRLIEEGQLLKLGNTITIGLLLSGDELGE